MKNSFRNLGQLIEATLKGSVHESSIAHIEVTAHSSLPDFKRYFCLTLTDTNIVGKIRDLIRTDNVSIGKSKEIITLKEALRIIDMYSFENDDSQYTDLYVLPAMFRFGKKGYILRCCTKDEDDILVHRQIKILPVYE